MEEEEGIPNNWTQKGDDLYWDRTRWLNTKVLAHTCLKMPRVSNSRALSLSNTSNWSDTCCWAFVLVEKILSHKGVGDNRMYLVRWKGYSSKHDSWEPISSFNTRGIIKKYHQAARHSQRSVKRGRKHQQNLPAKSVTEQSCQNNFFWQYFSKNKISYDFLQIKKNHKKRG